MISAGMIRSFLIFLGKIGSFYSDAVSVAKQKNEEPFLKHCKFLPSISSSSSGCSSFLSENFSGGELQEKKPKRKNKEKERNKSCLKEGTRKSQRCQGEGKAMDEQKPQEKIYFTTSIHNNF